MSPKKILILSPYPENCAPSQRLKYEQYFDYFEENGYEITVKPFVSKKFWRIIYKKGFIIQKSIFTISGYIHRFFQLFTLHQYDVVYVHLWATPIGFPIFEYLVQRLSKKLIYDIDDMIFLGHSSDANQYMQIIKGKKKMIYLMKTADHVITCTPTLDQFVRKYNSQTTDISSTINTDLYLSKKDNVSDGPIILGWSGSHSTSKYLHLLEPVFENLLEKNIDFKVLVIGNENFVFENSAIPLIAIPWQLDSEVEDLSKIDIGLYPLPDEEWVLGKSGLKALQYMALGIPTIASKIGANHRIISSEENGFLVDIGNHDGWIENIVKLINDKKLRKTTGEKGRQTVVDKYSINANKSTYLSILENVIHDDKAHLAK